MPLAAKPSPLEVADAVGEAASTDALSVDEAAAVSAVGEEAADPAADEE